MKTYRDFVSDLPRRPAIVAHRGAWHLAPENSVASILRAAEAGYEVVEIDVQCSADGVLFLMHDETLTRMTGEAALAQSLSWAELRALALRAGDGQGDAAPTAHRIPTLQEALEAAHWTHLPGRGREIARAEHGSRRRRHRRCRHAGLR